MQQISVNLVKMYRILLLLSCVCFSRSEELSQQKKLFEPHGTSQTYSGVSGNGQDSYMLAYHATRNQGFHPQSNHSPTEHIVEHPNLSFPHGERHYAVVAQNAQSSGERVPTEQERLLLLNQLKREQSEAIARARAVAQSPPVVVSNDISILRHAPANYIKQVQIQQIAPVPSHNQIVEQNYINLQGHNQIPAQHYINLQAQNQPSVQHYTNIQSQNHVPVQHVINIPTQHQVQIQQSIDVPTHNQMQTQHVVSVPNQNQLSGQRHHPTSLIRHYAIPATKTNNAEVERPVQYEEEKKVYVNAERQVPVERYVGVDNHIAIPTRQEAHLQAYAQEPVTNLRQAWNAQRHY